MANPTYYDGDLAGDLVAAALVTIERDGPASVSIRSLAREVGVSHAAPKSHFRDKASLFSAIATQGFIDLSLALRGVREVSSSRPLVEGGVAYVDYALGHRGHFAVMWQPDLYALTDELVASRQAASAALAALVDRDDDPSVTLDAANQAWALAHGWASLLLSGAFQTPTPNPLDYVRQQLTRADESVARASATSTST